MLRVLIGAVVLLTAACEPPSHAAPWGRDATEQFSDPNVARLADAACEGDVGSVARAIRAGANPNSASLEGGTPLHWAVACNNIRGVEALLRAGADPNLKSGRASATYLAALRGSPAVLALILRSEGDPNSYEGNDQALNALYAALLRGVGGDGWENWTLLLNAGANIEQHNEMGDTVAIHALNMSAYDQVIELLDRGYDFRLSELGYAVQTFRIDTKFADSVAKLARIRRMLEERGVQFPVRPPWEQTRRG